VSPGQLCVQASSTTPISLLHAQRVKNAVRILTMTTRWLLGRHASCLVSGIDNDERRRRDWEALLHCFRCSPSIWSFCCYEQKHCNNRLYISCLFVGLIISPSHCSPVSLPCETVLRAASAHLLLTLFFSRPPQRPPSFSRNSRSSKHSTNRRDMTYKVATKCKQARSNRTKRVAKRTRPLSPPHRKQHSTRRRPRAFPLLHPLAMQAVPEVLLKVLDHAVRQRRVHLAGTVVAADAWQVHGFGAFRGARARAGNLGRAEDGVGAGGDEVGFHDGFEIGVWVAAAEDGYAGVEPRGRVGL
jgi:hypothetical protein